MAHTFLNLGFETAEATPGDAFAWGKTIVSSLVAHANFGSSSASPFESLEEGWNNSAFLFLFAQTDLARAQFPSGDVDPLVADGFEVGWLNDTFSFGLSSIDDAEFDAGSVTFEDYEDGWANDTWEGTLSSVSVGLFDGGANAFENFDFAFPQNAFGYWPALSEVQGDFVDGFDGASPGGLPVGVVFVDSPRRIQLPAGFTAGGGKGFLEVGFKVGDQISGQGADNNAGDLWTIQALTNEEVTVQLSTWLSPGVSTTPMRIHELWPADLVDGEAFPPLGVLDVHEFFDASTFEEMDTM